MRPGLRPPTSVQTGTLRQTRHAALLATMASLTAAYVGGCSDASPGGSATVSVQGEWSGERLSFEFTAAGLTDWKIVNISCQENAEDPNVTEPVCVEKPAATSTDLLLVEAGEFKGTLNESLAIFGTIDGTSVTGTWTFIPGQCCTGTGTWSATFVPPPEPIDPPDDPLTTGGATGTDTGGPGPVGAPPDPLPPQTGEQVNDGDYAVAPDASAAQIAALDRTNWYRKNVGVQLVDMDPAINLAAQSHANYYEKHVAAYNSGQIPGGAHAESSAFADGFTGEDFGDRMAAAGYMGSPGFEVMAFIGNPVSAVDGWVETVYHRIPYVTPEMIDAGYGGSSKADVMNFGRGGANGQHVVVYPWDGQTGLKRSWDGYESPQPPPPESGYPSGTIITLTTSAGMALEIDSHQILDPAGTPLDHVWHPKGSNGFMSATWALYANSPLEPETTYTVSLSGQLAGSAWSKEWSFTTK